MQFIRNIKNLRQQHRSCVVSIGNFDGMHLGHQQVLARLVAKARELKLASVVVLFEPQPMEYFLPKRASARLMTLREKLAFLCRYDIDTVLCLKFNKQLAEMTAEQFVEQILLDKLNTRSVVVGDDFSFGSNRAGGFELLHQYPNLHAEQLTSLQVDGIRVSSTHIRQALAAGDFTVVTKLLDRPYTMSGHVTHGNKLGRSLGFPTANIVLRHKVLPFTGVFAVKVLGLADQPLLAIANVGTRPTINGKSNILEVHIPNFSQDIYGKKIIVEFLHKIREEIKFDSLDELKHRIQQDVASLVF